MSTDPIAQHLTPALEDYLESVYELVRDRKVARVRDIARARNVKAGSVSPALKRLAELGLVRYEQRELIELTDLGEATARRIYARHQVLYSFLEEVLDLPKEVAETDACAMEHHLSDQAMDRLVRLFEYMRTCPNASPEFIERFHRCARVGLGHGDCAQACEHSPARTSGRGKEEIEMSLMDLVPGQTGIIRQVSAQGAIRQRLLDMGMLPDVRVQMERVAPSGDPIWVKLGGYHLSLRRQEARSILIDPA